MSRLNIVVLYDRVLVDEEAEQGPSTDKAPVTRTLDKKEVEDEVAEALVKLGHEVVKHELDGTPRSPRRGPDRGARRRSTPGVEASDQGARTRPRRTEHAPPPSSLGSRTTTGPEEPPRTKRAAPPAPGRSG